MDNDKDSFPDSRFYDLPAEDSSSGRKADSGFEPYIIGDDGAAPADGAPAEGKENASPDRKPDACRNDGGDDSDDDEKGAGPSAFLLMLKVLASPLEGWKSIRRSGLKPEKVARDCFYPLCAVVAVCQFMAFFYDVETTVTKVLVNACVAFVSVFFSYFLVIVASQFLMPKGAKEAMQTPFAKVFVMVALSTLCLFYIIYELLPMFEAIIVFFPLWTVYIICQGSRFLKFPAARSTTSLLILCLLIVGVPIILGWGFDRLLTLNTTAPTQP